MPRRVFITGLTGFAGSHLAEHLVTRGDEVHGLAHEDPPYPYLAAVARDVTVHRGDITRYDDLRAALGGARPDVVVHLAGLAVPALAQRAPRSAVSVAVVRHGPLDAEPDFIDVRDMAKAYAAAAELGEAATYNVGSGRPVAIRVILETLVGFARVPIRTELDPARGAAGRSRVALDATRFRQKTGWSPRIGLAESLRDALDRWRAAIAERAGAGGRRARAAW